MTTKKQEIRRLQRTVQHLRARIEELNELVGVERGRAQVLATECSLWKGQSDFWEQKAAKAANEALKERRKHVEILGDRPAVQEHAEEGMEGWRKALRAAAENHRKKEEEAAGAEEAVEPVDGKKADVTYIDNLEQKEGTKA